MLHRGRHKKVIFIGDKGTLDLENIKLHLNDLVWHNRIYKKVTDVHTNMITMTDVDNPDNTSHESTPQQYHPDSHHERQTHRRELTKRVDLYPTKQIITRGYNEKKSKSYRKKSRKHRKKSKSHRKKSKSHRKKSKSHRKRSRKHRKRSKRH